MGFGVDFRKRLKLAPLDENTKQKQSVSRGQLQHLFGADNFLIDGKGQINGGEGREKERERRVRLFVRE